MLVRLAKRFISTRKYASHYSRKQGTGILCLKAKSTLLGSYIRSNRKSLKEMDAIKLVKYLKEHYESTNAISTRCCIYPVDEV